MLGNRTYSIDTYIKMVNFKCNQINLKTCFNECNNYWLFHNFV